MRHVLKIHADSRCEAVTGITVDVVRPGPATLSLRYTVTGDMSKILLPSRAISVRSDDLWTHTCFEAFFRRASEEAYNEFNFSPSTCWAVYWFDGYRRGMRNAAGFEDLEIEAHLTARHYELSASVALDRICSGPSPERCRAALSVIIEETNGRRSFWALAHPNGPPDFHHSDCFAIDLPKADHP